MRVCVVYDCLFPYTVGGAERWYRNLAERLSADGHEVTYLTLRQWDRGEQIDLEAQAVFRDHHCLRYISGHAADPIGKPL